MDIETFCKGSRKLAVKYRYYLKYDLILALCFMAPIAIFVLDYLNIVDIGRLKIRTFYIVLICIAWLVVLVIGFKGRGSVKALRYQIFGVTSDKKIVHFWFKEMLLDGKVVLHFKPYHKIKNKDEYIDVIKKKEDVIKDKNFEEYLCTLCNDESVQRKSDILYEVMEDIRVLKEKRKYLVVSYTIGKYKTKKKLKIYKNLTNQDLIMSIIKQ